VGKVKVKVMQSCDANGENGTPVSSAKALLYRSTTNGGTKLFAVEPTNADGTSELFIKSDALAGGNVRFAVRVDDGTFAGSMIHKDDGAGNNTYSTTFVGGTNLRADINADANKTLDIGNVCLPEGGIVDGTVINTAGEPVVNAVVEVFDCAGGCSGNKMIHTRTNIEGKYKISLPAGMEAGLRVQISRVNGTYSSFSASTKTTVVADETTTIDLSIAMTEPLGVFGEAGDSQATIYWKPVPGAASYKVYMGTATGVSVSDTLIASPTTNSYTHTGLTNDTAYYFVVTAVDAGSNESAISEEVTVTPSATATGS